ncbi:hypothetical protein EMCRGX_G004352 [Ephydatia muelleri]
MNYSYGNLTSVGATNMIVLAICNSTSVVVCLLASTMVLVFRLYRKVVYRLALYQVLSSLALAFVSVFQIIFINYHKNTGAYDRACSAIAWLTLYAEWMKLLFTMWVTFHLFCFAVLLKNLKKLEALYITTSLFAPAMVASVPLITHSYGLSPDGSLCYIYVARDDAFIERFALWDAPALVLLFMASTAMVVMVIKLAQRAYWRSSYEPISGDDQFQKALKHLLPLAAFPILFFIFIIPVVIFHIYVAKSSTSKAQKISTFVFYSLWTMNSGVTLIVHISVARCLARKKVEAVQHFLFGIAIDEGFKGPQANTLAWDVLYPGVKDVKII